MSAVPTFERRPAPSLPYTRPPTARQLEVLAFLRAYIKKNGASPTLREIGTALGIRSTNGVDSHLHYLERRGLIARADGKTRSIRIVDSVVPEIASVANGGGHPTRAALARATERLDRLRALVAIAPPIANEIDLVLADLRVAGEVSE